MALVLFLIECREEADFRRKGEGDKKKKKYTGVKTAGHDGKALFSTLMAT